MPTADIYINIPPSFLLEYSNWIMERAGIQDAINRLLQGWTGGDR